MALLLKKDKIIQKDQIKELISNSFSFIAWDYNGLNSQQVAEMKKKAIKANSKDIVFKNRIVIKALEELKMLEMIETLTGQTSFLFIKDEDSTALKDLYDFAKEIDSSNLRIKAGYINGEFLGESSIMEIASLPSKDELLSMLLSALSGNVRNLAVVLSEVSKQKN